MAIIPGEYQHGLFWDVGDRVTSIGWYFYNLADRGYNLPLIGGLLYNYFYDVATKFFELGNTFRGWDYTLWRIARGISHLFDYHGIGDLITEVMWFWEWFRTDPKGFIQAQWANLLNIPQPYASYPDTWFNYILNRLWSHWSQFIMDPWGFILDRITAWNPSAGYLLRDPIGAIRWWFGDLLGVSVSIRGDMRLWPKYILISLWAEFDLFLNQWRVWLEGRIDLYFPQLSLFVRNPIGWLLSDLEFHYGIPTSAWSNFPVSMILWGLEKLEQYRDGFYTQMQLFLCKFIRYMLEGVWRP
jgi:hypothetical protein